MLINMKNLRGDYSLGKLDMDSCALDPYEQFEEWMEMAFSAKLPEPTAMTLATVDATGQPNARVVLLKGVKEAEGFIFYSNYQSDKGEELAYNPKAALVFYWEALQRQVRIQGVVSKISVKESTAYFQSRPKGSQIGATASPQSRVLPNRKALEEKVLALEAQYKGKKVLPRPDCWGGYMFKATQFEFWQGRSNRLHDRIRYVPDGAGWQRVRLGA